MNLIHRQLGALDINIAPVSLGTVKIGRNNGVKYPGTFELPSDKQVVHLLSQARDHGINLIDTAPAYGSSEARLGKLLPGPREDWVICTKAGEHFDGEHSNYDYSAAAMNNSIDQSLRSLGTSYLDIVLIHSDGNDLDILQHSDAVATLKDRQRKGDIRYIGLSGKTVAGAQMAMGQCDVLMVTLNLSDRSHVEVVKQAAISGKGVLVKKALDSGHADPDDNLAFVLSTPGVSSMVVGTINPEHLQENIEITIRALTASE